MKNIVEATPKLWDVVFSLKTFAASMLAFWIALVMDLPNPYWSLAAVYIVAHPLSGATTSKGFYRLLGTVIGGAATIVLVPTFINSPELLTLVISLWMAVCLMISLLDGTPRSYLFMLAGYTVAIAAFVVVSKPETTFDYALGRVEEIALGIICAAVINRLVFPRHTGPVLVSRIDNWLRDGAGLVIKTLDGDGESEAVLKIRQRLAADTLDIRNMTTHVAYDTSSMRNVGAQLSVLQQRMVAVLPIVSSLQDVLSQRLAGSSETWPKAAQELIDETRDWFDSGESLTAERRARFLSLMDEVEQQSQPNSTWTALILANFASRIRDLVQIWSDCIAIRQSLLSGDRHSLRWRRYDAHLAARPMHRDFGMALLSGFATILSTCIATAFWIASAWTQGGAAAMMAGIFCCIFATMDNPVPVMRKFGWLLLVVIPAVFVVQFAMLPLVDGFLPLVLILGLILVPAGILLTIPSQMLLGMVICINLPNMLMLQSKISLDFVTFANANLATVLGIIIAAVVTSIVRSVGTEWAAARLIKAGWQDIATAASRQVGRHRRRRANQLLQRMIDRIGMITPRLAALGGTELANVDMLRDLRNGMNTIDLQQFRSKLDPASLEAVDVVLARTETHYRNLIRHGSRDAQSEELLTSIDRAITSILAHGSKAAARRCRMALVSLRFNLFPDAAPYQTPTPPGPVLLPANMANVA